MWHWEKRGAVKLLVITYKQKRVVLAQRMGGSAKCFSIRDESSVSEARAQRVGGVEPMRV